MADLEQTGRAARAADTFHIVTDADRYTVYKDCTRRGSRTSPAQAVALLMASINLAVLDRCPHFAVHAAVVARDDRIVAFPADSGEGKSTLAAACLRAGFHYLSDEALVLDDQGRVVPYPKPVALSEWSRRRLGLEGDDEESLYASAHLGSSPHPGERPVSEIVLMERGHGETTLDPLPRSEAVPALLSRSFNHYKDPARAFRLATVTAGDSKVWRLRYDDPVEAAAALWDRFA